MLNLKIQDYPKVHIIHISGELNALTSAKLSQVIDERFQMNISFVVLDFLEVSDLTSAAQSVILKAHLQSQVTNTNVKMVLCNLTEDIHWLVQITGLSRLVTVYLSLDEALKSIELPATNDYE
ncbi:MAG: STAS domain-containing protein [Methylococcales bacterium]|nr:STAS domain-containing protein [Methylococcales bacterium]